MASAPTAMPNEPISAGWELTCGNKQKAARTRIAITGKVSGCIEPELSGFFWPESRAARRRSALARRPDWDDSVTPDRATGQPGQRPLHSDSALMGSISLRGVK